MAAEPRNRLPRSDDDPDTPYRLRDDEEEPPPVAPRARPTRRPHDADDTPGLRPLRRRRPRSMSVPAMDNWVRLAVIGGLLLLGLIGLGCFGVWYLFRSAQTAPFQAAMPAYLSQPVGVAPPGALRVVVGKMIVVDTAKKDVDWDVFFSLPDDRRASRPQEVGTIVWTNWDKVLDQQYEYEGHVPAYRQTCHVTVIDRKSRTILLEQQFVGSDPPQSISTSASEGVGSRPTQQVQDYLKGLPKG